MIIDLTVDRRLTSDENQFSLEKKKVIKGEERWVPYRYYSTLAAALTALPEQLLKESSTNGFNAVRAFLNSLETRLNKAIEGKQ